MGDPKMLISYFCTQGAMGRFIKNLELQKSYPAWERFDKILVTDLTTQFSHSAFLDVLRHDVHVNRQGCFGGSCNMGLEYARRKDYDFFLNGEADLVITAWPSELRQGAFYTKVKEDPPACRVINWYLVGRDLMGLKWCEEYAGCGYTDNDYEDIVLCGEGGAQFYDSGSWGMHVHHPVHPFNQTSQFLANGAKYRERFLEARRKYPNIVSRTMRELNGWKPWG